MNDKTFNLLAWRIGLHFVHIILNIESNPITKVMLYDFYTRRLIVPINSRKHTCMYYIHIFSYEETYSTCTKPFIIIYCCDYCHDIAFRSGNMGPFVPTYYCLILFMLLARFRLSRTLDIQTMEMSLVLLKQ